MISEQEYILQVCKNIKQERLNRNLTQIEFACLIGIEDSNLRRLECGRTNPTLKTLIKISRALNISICDLMPIDC